VKTKDVIVLVLFACIKAIYKSYNNKHKMMTSTNILTTIYAACSYICEVFASMSQLHCDFHESDYIYCSTLPIQSITLFNFLIEPKF
jgi:surface polysaccharide O-acyltransferase-like enzyme